LSSSRARMGFISLPLPVPRERAGERVHLGYVTDN
jgi:hypothetical protein